MIKNHSAKSVENGDLFWNFVFNYLVAFGGVSWVLYHFC